MNEPDSRPDGSRPSPQQVYKQLEVISNLDCYAALGVERDVSSEDVRKTYLRLTKKWHPSLYALESDDLRAAVEEIFILIKHAFETLVDPTRAAAYRSRLPSSGARSSTSAVSAGAPSRSPSSPVLTATPPPPGPPAAPTPPYGTPRSPLTRTGPPLRPPPFNSAPGSVLTAGASGRAAMSPARPGIGAGAPTASHAAYREPRAPDTRPLSTPPKVPPAMATTRVVSTRNATLDPPRVAATPSRPKDPQAPTPPKGNPSAAPAFARTPTATQSRGVTPPKGMESPPLAADTFSEAREIARANNCLVDYNFKQARAHLERVLIASPTNPRAKALRAVADGLESQISGRIEAAKKFYGDALAIDPGCVEARTGLDELQKQRNTNAAEKKKSGLFRKLFFDE